MRLSIRVVVALMVVSLLGVVLAQAQDGQNIKSNPRLADLGAKIWYSRGCDGCHRIGGEKRIAPDLLGVTARRTVAWLRAWLRNPPEMAKSDRIAQQMIKDAGTVMPNLRLKDDDIEALLTFIQRENDKQAPRSAGAKVE